MKDNKKKRDLLLVAGILAAVCLLYVGNKFFFSKPAARVEVTVDGQTLMTFDLEKDTEITIDGYQGGTNHLIIKDGKAYVTEASCPDKVCVRQGKVHQTGEMIVCLPNRMVAKITGGEE